MRKKWGKRMEGGRKGMKNEGTKNTLLDFKGEFCWQ